MNINNVQENSLSSLNNDMCCQVDLVYNSDVDYSAEKLADYISLLDKLIVEDLQDEGVSISDINEGDVVMFILVSYINLDDYDSKDDLLFGDNNILAVDDSDSNDNTTDGSIESD